jgi:hypothetical protein
MSRVLKFFLHFSQTANRESGNLTLSDCLKPGGVNVKMFYAKKGKSRGQSIAVVLKIKTRSGPLAYSPRETLPVGTSFATNQEG